MSNIYLCLRYDSDGDVAVDTIEAESWIAAKGVACSLWGWWEDTGEEGAFYLISLNDISQWDHLTAPSSS